jgi:F0F1-type ATP synthase membrane subunit a
MLKLTTVFFVLTLGVMAVLHWLALSFYLYWRWEWVDIAMHGFGGAVVALGLFTIRDFVRSVPERFEYVGPIMAGVLIVVLLWELFEIFVVQIPLDVPGLVLDTSIDIVMGALGGFVGFLVGHSLRRL